MRILHTMVRVGDLERSIRFYTDVMKMKLLRKREFPEGKFTLAFVGYGDEADSAVLELTNGRLTVQFTGNDNYIDGNWELWGFTCEQPLTLPNGDVLLVP